MDFNDMRHGGWAEVCPHFPVRACKSFALTRGKRGRGAEEGKLSLGGWWWCLAEFCIGLYWALLSYK